LIRCPNDKTGADCYVIANLRQSNLSDNEESRDADDLRFVVKLVAISVIATLMIVVSVYVIVKR